MNQYQCFWYAETWEDMNVNFIPIVDSEEGWYAMNDTIIHGTPAKHYRIVEDYIGTGQEQQNMNYTDVRTYEQDFYCTMNGTNCIPMKWYMQSKSNMDSHYDIYIIHYSQFNFSTEPDDFDFFLYDANCGEESQTVKPKDVTHNIFPGMRVKKTKAKNVVAQKNLALINEWRQNKHFTFKVAPNHFIDMEHEQFKATKTGRLNRKIAKDDQYTTYLYTPLSEDLPKNFDWRVKGVMTYAKDQLFCGSCWAFSAVGCLESRINIDRVQSEESAPLITLSEQKVVDCNWDTSGGCEGGDENGVLLTWATNQQATFPTEHNYPYLGEDDYCKNNLDDFTDYTVASYHEVPDNDIVQMKRAIMTGPVSIGVAVPPTFVFYAGGIYNDPACGTEVDHAVLAIGWGNSEFGPYWIVRNSWSPLWGQDGYIYIAMKDNLCSITSGAAYVTVAKNQ